MPKTPIQEMISYIERQMDCFSRQFPTGDMPLSARGMYDAYLNDLKHANTLLDPERVGLEEAYNQGSIDGPSYEKSGVEYFKIRYNHAQ